MLMTGWYPCIPGWHLDDIPRTRKDGQPDHRSPIYKADHVMGIVGEVSKTEFVFGKLRLYDVPEGKGTIYEIWNKEIDLLLKRGRIKIRAVEPGRVIYFDHECFHRGTPTTRPGWRWFIRITRNSQRKFLNEVRTQTQVYLTAPFDGW